MTTIRFTISDNTEQHLQAMVDTLHVSGAREMTVALLCKQVIENHVADRRAAKRLVMPASHYVARNSGDEWEAE